MSEQNQEKESKEVESIEEKTLAECTAMSLHSICESLHSMIIGSLQTKDKYIVGDRGANNLKAGIQMEMGLLSDPLLHIKKKWITVGMLKSKTVKEQ